MLSSDIGAAFRTERAMPITSHPRPGGATTAEPVSTVAPAARTRIKPSRTWIVGQPQFRAKTVRGRQDQAPA